MRTKRAVSAIMKTKVSPRPSPSKVVIPLYDIYKTIGEVRMYGSPPFAVHIKSSNVPSGHYDHLITLSFITPFPNFQKKKWYKAELTFREEKIGSKIIKMLRMLKVQISKDKYIVYDIS